MGIQLSGVQVNSWGGRLMADVTAAPAQAPGDHIAADVTTQPVSTLTPPMRSAVALGRTRRYQLIRMLLQSEHAPIVSIVLHLLPAVLTGAAYLLLRRPVITFGYPSAMALYFAILFALVPYGLGVLLYLGYKRNARLSLDEVVLYRRHMPVGMCILYGSLVFAASLVVILVGQAVLDPGLQTTVFGWMPVPDYGLDGSYPKGVLVISYALMATGLSLEVAVEELYFRGFLLCRMRYSGRWTVPLHGFLYALYHLWIPWRLVSLTIGIVPLLFAVRIAIA